MGMYAPVGGSYRVTSQYQGGFRSTGGHSGIDFGAPAGSLVRAVVPGTVISVGWGGAYGNLVKVRHADGSIGYYAHNRRNIVRPGQRVSRGTPLGYVGSTGNTTGPHSHFEVRINGKPTNPMPWLTQNYRATSATSNQRMQPGLYDGIRLSDSQLRNAQTIISVGQRMGANQRDILIGLMTAMQESHLQNLDYGDRDSLGLFQQRPSAGWGSPGQIMNPEYAAMKFFDSLLRLGNRGRMRLTEAAQAVQRSAFPEAYAKWEELGRAILGSPGAGNYSIGAYDRFYQNQTVLWNDPASVMAAFGVQDSIGLQDAMGSPTDTVGGGPADTMGSGPADTVGERPPVEIPLPDVEPVEEEDLGFEWGPFAQPDVVEEAPQRPKLAPAGRGRLEY